ncbi:EAL domain-containing protein [Catenulispora subtropica]|uniref:Diguanylate cyclase/phosphodiesterase with PAS/PAC sensor(S) n=1 Tax=Catenulispora subtropica TaxID=450798 RepID=A0ABN2SCT4_9ACTN
MGAALILITLLAPGAAVRVRFAAAGWAVAAMAYGVRAYDPPHRSVWGLLAASVIAFQCSDFGDLHRQMLSPRWTDWLSLTGYPLAALALSAMVRLRSAGRDVAGFLDAAVGTLALLVPTWVFLVEPFMRNAGWSTARLEAILPPIGDVLLLGILLRLLAASPRRGVSLWLLTAGVAVGAACDVGQGLLQLSAAPWFGTPLGRHVIELGWLTFNLLWGAAALAPDMRWNTEPIPVRKPQPVVMRARIALLTLAALAEPMVAVVLLAQDEYSLGVFGPLIEAAIIILIMVRVSLVLLDYRTALRREQILVSATGPLVAAAGVEEIAAVLTSTATRLAGSGTPHRVAVVVEDQGRFHVAGAGVAVGAAEPEGPEAPDRFGASGASGISDAVGAVGAPATPRAREDPEAPDWTTWRHTLSALGRTICAARLSSGLVRTADLPPALAEALGGFDHALVLPLGTEAWRDDVWAAGVLAAAAPERALLAMAAPLEILTGQGALSLQRLALGMEIARRDGERYFQALVQNDSDAILIVDTDARVRYASPSAEAMFGPSGLLGRPASDLLGPVNAGQLAARLAEPARRPPQRRDWILDRPDHGDAPREIEATVSDLRDEPTVNGLVLSLRDVTTAREMERALQRQAYRDALTGLPNRAAFLLGLDDALERAGPGSRVGLVLVDVDQFREINDFHGRAVGDDVLRATADLLRRGLAPGDLLARVGVDEFAVLRVRPDSEASGFPLGVPGETESFAVGPVTVTTSGAFVEAGPGATGARLMADAEIAQHAALEARRPRSWRHYDPAMRADLARVAERRAGLDKALAEGAFVLLYQPIVRLADRALVAFESLIRWPRPDGSVVMPDDFIGLAEATGQIVPLGSWILRTATACAADWNRECEAAGRPPVRVTVNVSAHELRTPSFPGTVAAALEASGLAPDLLILEATESSLIIHADRAQANLRAVRDQGVRLALDDFGTGYSSLRYLRDLPVTSLKIDKGFTAEVGVDERQTALMAGIVDIGRALGLGIVAEGIENETQCRRVRAMGVTLGQGWLFGRPMTAEQAAERVREGTGAVGTETETETAEPG